MCLCRENDKNNLSDLLQSSENFDTACLLISNEIQLVYNVIRLGEFVYELNS